jgi:hypothetical protein
MNLLLSGLPPKHKIEIILNWQGRSPCPMDIEQNCGDAEWVSGKYVYMATCLSDPAYIRLREESLMSTAAVDVPEDFANLSGKCSHEKK